MEPAQIAAACATVRAFAEGAGAVRVVLLLDTGDPAAPILVELDARGLEVTAGGATLPYAIPEEAEALPLPPLRPVPASAVSADAETGELSAPLGSIRLLADSLLALAAAVGGRSVATATFPTADTATPLTLAARVGEDVVLDLAGRHFSLPAESGS